MLYSYLSQIKFVVEAKSEGGSFEDKYIAKFWQKLHVIIIKNEFFGDKLSFFIFFDLSKFSHLREKF